MLPKKISLPLKLFYRYIPQSANLHPVLVAGIAQYEFVRIHPFTDGNGRSTRALATLILYQQNFDIKHFFALDAYYNENRENYYSALEYVDQQKLNKTQWLEYFIEGAADQMNKLKNRIETLAREPIFKKIGNKLIIKKRQWKVLEYLKEKGQIYNLQYQKIANISREMAKRDLAYLVKEKTTKRLGQGRNIYYIFHHK